MCSINKTRSDRSPGTTGTVRLPAYLLTSIPSETDHSIVLCARTTCRAQITQTYLPDCHDYYLVTRSFPEGGAVIAKGGTGRNKGKPPRHISYLPKSPAVKWDKLVPRVSPSLSRFRPRADAIKSAAQQNLG